jgi:8-oxo-dGTP pyrophosphatase MutT (NUDIX family)
MGLHVKVHVKFNIAGGKCHLGETSVACAKRELEEETHITLDADLYNSATIYNGVDQTGTYYYIDVSDKIL